ALVLAVRPAGALPSSGPDRSFPEVVKSCASAASGGVERLFREARVAACDVADHAARPVPESHGRLDVIFLRPGNGVDLLRKTARPPAQRVDEMTAFSGEA